MPTPQKSPPPVPPPEENPSDPGLLSRLLSPPSPPPNPSATPSTPGIAAEPEPVITEDNVEFWAEIWGSLSNTCALVPRLGWMAISREQETRCARALLRTWPGLTAAEKVAILKYLFFISSVFAVYAESAAAWREREVQELRRIAALKEKQKQDNAAPQKAA